MNRNQRLTRQQRLTRLRWCLFPLGLIGFICYFILLGFRAGLATGSDTVKEWLDQ